MFALIQWTVGRKITIMEETPEMNGIEVGEDLDLPYNGKKYRGKLILRSGKYKNIYLNK